MMCIVQLWTTCTRCTLCCVSLQLSCPYVQVHNTDLASQFEILKRHLTEVRNAAQHEMILDESYEHVQVITYIASLEDQMDDLTQKR
jgi:hypothetical protein